MVNTKDQSNAIVYWVGYLVCQHWQYKDQSTQCILCYVCSDCQYIHWCLWLLHNTLYRVDLLWGVKTLHKVASCPCQEGLLLCEPSILGVSCSPVSPRRPLLLTFLDLTTMRVIAGKWTVPKYRSSNVYTSSLFKPTYSTVWQILLINTSEGGSASIVAHSLVVTSCT